MLDEPPCILYNGEDDDNIITCAFTGRCTRGIRRPYKNTAAVFNRPTNCVDGPQNRLNLFCGRTAYLIVIQPARMIIIINNIIIIYVWKCQSSFHYFRLPTMNPRLVIVSSRLRVSSRSRTAQKKLHLIIGK